MADYDIAHAADSIDPVRYVVNESAQEPEVCHHDLTPLALAGAKLTYALYHSGAAFVASMPDAVTRAYAHACTVFDVAGQRYPADVDQP